jgi:hypothetical protein
MAGASTVLVASAGVGEIPDVVVGVLFIAGAFEQAANRISHNTRIERRHEIFFRGVHGS